jgi:hypothetical protein
MPEAKILVQRALLHYALKRPGSIQIQPPDEPKTSTSMY